MVDPITAQDSIVRRQVYEEFVSGEGVPSAADLADQLNLPLDEIRGSLRRLGEARALVLEPGGTSIRMAQPFAAAGGLRVEAGHRAWQAPCAWDALGIPALLRLDAALRDTCGDCGEPIRIEVRDGIPRGAGEVVHFLVPAARWWEDIFFT
jgi:hypothetical protein